MGLLTLISYEAAAWLDLHKSKNDQEDAMKKRILIYGDSNTHGFDAETGGRFDENTRWTGVCQNLLGEDYVIVEEGLNGRTTCLDDPLAPFCNGLAYIVPCILSQLPLDMICVKLGSNDLDRSMRQTPEMMAANAAKVLKTARAALREKYPDSSCQYVLMAPLETTEDALNGPFGYSYDEETIAVSKTVAKAYEKQAEKEGFLYFDANKYARCGSIDGVHLDAENHRKLGVAFASWLKERWQQI